MSFINPRKYKVKVTSLRDFKDMGSYFEAVRCDNGKKIKCTKRNFNFWMKASKRVRSKHYNLDGYVESGMFMMLLEGVNPEFKESMDNWRKNPHKTDLRNTSFYLDCYNIPAIFAQYFGHIHYWKVGRLEFSDEISVFVPFIIGRSQLKKGIYDIGESIENLR